MWGSLEEDQKSCKKIAAELKTTLRAISFSQIEWSHFTRSHFAKNCLKFLILWSHFPPKQPNWNFLQHICKVGTPLSVGFMRVSGNKSWKPQQRPPPYYAVMAHVSSGTQMWSYYYASLPSARNAVILLKVLDSRHAPFSCLNYVQLFSAEAPLCCSWLLNRCSAALVWFVFYCKSECGAS